MVRFARGICSDGTRLRSRFWRDALRLEVFGAAVHCKLHRIFYWRHSQRSYWRQHRNVTLGRGVRLVPRSRNRRRTVSRTTMDNGEFLTRAMIWITIVAYTVGSVLFARSQGRMRWDAAVRVAWTIAVVSLIAHFICAYQFFHHWSQNSAVRETARQTEEVVGLN